MAGGIEGQAKGFVQSTAGVAAKLAAQVIEAFVRKQRRRENNIRVDEAPRPAAPAPPSPATEPAANPL